MEMVIGGLQKMTLLDYPGKVACTVFLPGCNLRCPYCHNSSLVLPPKIRDGFSLDQLLEFLQRRRGKLDGVCITGGEPTIHRDLPELIRKIRDLGFLIKLDTNGSNPGMLKQLAAQQMIDYVAMDIKNSPRLYGETCGGISFLDAVSESLAFLKQGSVDYELRTTVCKPLHTEQSMEELAIWIQGARRYFLQNFADSGDLIGTGMHPFSQEELERFLTIARRYVPDARIRGQ